jgi:hypothetical protein
VTQSLARLEEPTLVLLRLTHSPPQECVLEEMGEPDTEAADAPELEGDRWLADPIGNNQVDLQSPGTRKRPQTGRPSSVLSGGMSKKDISLEREPTGCWREWRWASDRYGRPRSGVRRCAISEETLVTDKAPPLRYTVFAQDSLLKAV